MSKTIEYPEAKHVIISGDIHGDFKTLVYKLCVGWKYTDTLLIVAGDCGFGFEKPGYYETIYNQVAGRLRKANNWVVFIRGNHDDPAYFAEERVKYERWRCVPDYSIIRAAGHNILVVGGAVSVDRKVRIKENEQLKQLGHTQTASCWESEAPEYKPEEIINIPADINIDTVVTHSSPSLCEPRTKDGLKAWAVYDPALIWDCAKERETMDKILACLGEHHHAVERWYYGHFHSSRSEMIEGVTYRMLDILEFNSL
ncbi:MAG: metallophosphoesterase [Paludibacteraceae bacterium]|nr:metallophosphoesterase [Paludibacteraceae bacterium]